MNRQKINEFSKRAFIKLDLDKSGYIERIELVPLLKAMAEEMNSKPPTENEIDKVMEYLDKNKDGKISQDEFVVIAEMLLKLIKQL